MSTALAVTLAALAIAAAVAWWRIKTLNQLTDNQHEVIESQEETIKDILAAKEGLRKITDRLRREVANRENRIEDLARQVVLEQNAYTRYQCTFCGGTGIQQSTGSVHMHPGQKLKAENPCDVCKGDGYLYKRKLEPTEEETEQERLARRYKEGIEAAEVSLQTTDPAVLRVAAREKLDDPDKVKDKLYRAYWRGFMIKVAEAIDELEEDMQVDTPLDTSSDTSGHSESEES